MHAVFLCAAYSVYHDDEQQPLIAYLIAAC